MTARRSVHLVTLGCARNDVDSEELAARMAGAGWELTDSELADVTVVNTCGFVEAAKKDSIDAILAASDASPSGKVVAVGCLAQRYGAELAQALPEAVVLSFDDYARIDERLGYPTHDPHGDPIPDARLNVALQDLRSLDVLEPGEQATVRRVPDGDADLLRYLAGLTLVPGQRVTMRKSEPFGGPLTVDVEGSEHAISRELAERIGVS